MNRKSTLIVGVLSVAVIIFCLLLVNGRIFEISARSVSEDSPIKIGIITDRTGPAAYWGESTYAGAVLASADLKAKGYNVEFIYEDYQLDAAKAVSVAQKLVEIDHVDALYTEFNPGTIAVASAVKDRNIPMIYDAAIVSPLESTNLFFKTYLDYKAGCKAVAQKFKDEGVAVIGMLKINIEAGELCSEGVHEVYGASVIEEAYNLGDTDVRTQLTKVLHAGATAVIDVGFESDAYNGLKAIHDLRTDVRFGSVDDFVTDKVKSAFPAQMKGAVTFGFPGVDSAFIERVDASSGSKKVATYYAAALAYTHLPQLVQAIATCKKDTECVTEKIENSEPNAISGFKGFNGRVADLAMVIKEY